MDLRQGGDDDRRVEHDHQLDGEDDREDDGRGASGAVREAESLPGGSLKCGSESARMETRLRYIWRPPPLLKELYGGPLRFVKPKFRIRHPILTAAPEARRRGAQLRQAARRRPRGLHRGRRGRLAGGHRPPRRRRHRHAVPQLPDAPGAARGRLRRRGRGDLPRRRGARRRRPVGGAARPGCAASPTTPRRRRRSPTS